jgi:hypothetical protein
VLQTVELFEQLGTFLHQTGILYRDEMRFLGREELAIEQREIFLGNETKRFEPGTRAVRGESRSGVPACFQDDAVVSCQFAACSSYTPIDGLQCIRVHQGGLVQDKNFHALVFQQGEYASPFPNARTLQQILESRVLFLGPEREGVSIS